MEQSARDRMAELRIVCERDVEIQRQKVDAAVNSFRKYLQFMKTRSKQTVDDQVKLGKLKAQLREVEDGLVKALAGGEIGWLKGVLKAKWSNPWCLELEGQY